MNNNTKKAEQLLFSENFTLVICNNEKEYKSKKRGVKPLVELIEKKIKLDGFSAADKVVGKAAAMLYALLGVCEVYAPVMSKEAVKTLTENGITAFYDQTADMIINRNGNGICPMEDAVREAVCPNDALKAIKKRLKRLENG